MPNASTHEQADANARQAADEKLGVERGKRNVAVDSQTDRFTRTANEAKRAGWQGTGDTRDNE